MHEWEARADVDGKVRTIAGPAARDLVQQAAGREMERLNLPECRLYESLDDGATWLETEETLVNSYWRPRG